MKKLTRVSDTLTVYGGKKVKVMAITTLQVHINGRKHNLHFKVMSGKHYQPLLSRRACLGIGAIKWMDVDSIRPFEDSPKPSSINKLEAEQATKTPCFEATDMQHKYAYVFHGLGKLPGQYHIEIDRDVNPVVHAPRRVPVALRDKLKHELREMVNDDIIAPVSEPTEWVSSLLLVSKPGKLRICMDPRDLNRAIRREHYQMPTIEELATRLRGARVFTVVDAKNGFWQVELDEESSRLTTFNTPFGRYRCKHMPFGISSAPEVWQRKMHETIEGLDGVEVIADDFLITGKDDAEHGANLQAFLNRCRERNLVLNAEKVRYKLQEVSFMGCLLTDEGMKPDPRRVEAVLDMPMPTDVEGVRRLIGTVQYLSKFVKGLTDLTAPLRELTRKKNHSLALPVSPPCEHSLQIVKGQSRRTRTSQDTSHQRSGNLVEQHFTFDVFRRLYMTIMVGNHVNILLNINCKRLWPVMCLSTEFE